MRYNYEIYKTAIGKYKEIKKVSNEDMKIRY